MSDFDKTMQFNFDKELENPVRGIIRIVSEAMREKGYDPVNQLIGYIVSGDPTYVTGYKTRVPLLRALTVTNCLKSL